MKNESPFRDVPYNDPGFMRSRDARSLRILAEYLEPLARFQKRRVDDTIVFMGSARIVAPEVARAAVEAAERGEGSAEIARTQLAMSAYYEAARLLAFRLTEWSKGLGEGSRRFVMCTGGGPGIMEAGNRGASEAGGLSVGLTIDIPGDEFENPHVTRELGFHFNYFFMRKFWFTYLAKAVVVFPGGYGTLDELFEILTLMQTRKMRKHLPVVLFGPDYWDEIVNFDALAKFGMVDADDGALMFRTNSVDDAYDFITGELIRFGLAIPGPVL